MTDEHFRSEVLAALPRLKSWAMRFYGNSADADDAVQDAVEQALISTKRPTTASVKTWMCSIVFYRFLNAVKARRRQPAYSGAPVDYAANLVGLDDQHATLELRQMIEQIERMPAAKAGVLVRTIFGMPEAEIAAEMGVPRGTVKSRLHKLRAKLAAQPVP